MAITDILTRISGDAATEAADVVHAARLEAARIVEAAEAAAAAESAAAIEAAEQDAARTASTMMANARLRARDRLLAVRRERAEAVLERAREALEALPDAEYLELMAAAVARAARSGETVSIAGADAGRLAGLGRRLAELGVQVDVSAVSAPIARGVMVTGDGVRVEVSPAAMIADRREELLLVAARELFGEEG